MTHSEMLPLQGAQSVHPSESRLAAMTTAVVSATTGVQYTSIPSTRASAIAKLISRWAKTLAMRTLWS